VLPTPGVNAGNVRKALEQAQQGNLGNIYGIVQLFSGGALLKLSVFALGIMPYITASIILQLLTVVIPRLEALKKEGQAGNAKITQYTRYLTIGLGVLQSTAFVAGPLRPAVRHELQRPAHPGQRRHLHHRDHGRHDDRRHGRDHVAG